MQGLRFGLLMSVAVIAVTAMAEQLRIGSDDIKSLANAPVLKQASGSVDAAGRPALDLTLTFANTCLADTGISINVAVTSFGIPAAIISQKINNQGCPDIFSPVDRQLTVLLPTQLSGQDLLLIARRSVQGDFLRVAFSRSSTATAGSANSIEAGLVGEDSKAVPELRNVTISPSNSGKGYRVSGNTNISTACIPTDLNITVYEVPDSEGDPSRDVVVITAPTSCLQADGENEITIEVATPQRNRGRSVTLLNSGADTPFSIQP